MPIISIQASLPKNEDSVPQMLSEIREQGARAIDNDPENIWVIFIPIQSTHTTLGPNCPIVTIMANRGRTPEQKTALVSAISEIVGKGLSAPAKNVWVHYEEMDPQNIWFSSNWSGINAQCGSVNFI